MTLTAGVLLQNKKATNKSGLSPTGNILLSQVVSNQVPSACECLTTVFGMGTGGSIQASSPDILLENTFFMYLQN